MKKTILVFFAVAAFFCSCNKQNTCVKYTMHTSYYEWDSLLRIDDYTVFKPFGQSTYRPDTLGEEGDIWLVNCGCNIEEDKMITIADQYERIYIGATK